MDVKWKIQTLGRIRFILKTESVFLSVNWPTQRYNHPLFVEPTGGQRRREPISIEPWMP